MSKSVVPGERKGPALLDARKVPVEQEFMTRTVVISEQKILADLKSAVMVSKILFVQSQDILDKIYLSNQQVKFQI